MYATGPELAMEEAAWEQGTHQFEEEQPHSYDVPAFIEGVHEALGSAEWCEQKDEAGRVDFLFNQAHEGGFRAFRSVLTVSDAHHLRTHRTPLFNSSTCRPRMRTHWHAPYAHAPTRLHPTGSHTVASTSPYSIACFLAPTRPCVQLASHRGTARSTSRA